jgi:alkanesulfonate monooxygenase SsuD/methylene tetrahydromethanopterin reductase-like flavin-dependent oxidoreductase (luciferase family)
VRFGVFTVADAYPTAGGSLDRDPVTEAVELAAHAEAAGFDQFWVGEHHFHHSGAIPSPPVVLAAAAARTRRLRLGPLVAVLPFHEPIRLAEEYAVLDRLSDGRVELAVGSGYMGREFRGFGLDAGARSDLFAERLPRFLAALRGEPTRASPGSPLVSLNVRPVQRPHPPLWVAAGRPVSIRDAGRRGLGIALIPYATLPGIDGLPDAVASYLQELPDGVTPRVLAAFHVGVGRRDRHLCRLQRFLDSRPDPEDPRLSAYRSGHPELVVAERLVDRGLTLIGTVAELRERIRWLGRIGVTDIAGIFDFGGAPFSETAASLQAWAEVGGFGAATPWPEESPPGEAPRSGLSPLAPVAARRTRAATP